MFQEFLDGLWPTYMVALRIIYAVIAKQTDGILVCNKLSNGLFAHSLPNADNGFDDKQVYWISAKPADELAIDFKVIEGKIVEVTKGCKARAEVVQSEPAATTMHPIGKVACRLQIGDYRRFSQLKHQTGRIYPLI